MQQLAYDPSDLYDPLGLRSCHLPVNLNKVNAHVHLPISIADLAAMASATGAVRVVLASMPRSVSANKDLAAAIAFIDAAHQRHQPAAGSRCSSRGRSHM